MMQFWIGNYPTLSQKLLESNYRDLTQRAQQGILSARERILKVVEGMQSTHSEQGLLAVTDSRFLYLHNQGHFSLSYSQINKFQVNDIEGATNNLSLEVSSSRGLYTFDHLSQNHDTLEFLEILEQKVQKPTQKILSTVTHDFSSMLHGEYVNQVKDHGVYVTQHVMKRDDQGEESNGKRLLSQMHPEAVLIESGNYYDCHQRFARGKLVVVDHLITVYDYDNQRRLVRKVFSVPYTYFRNCVIDFSPVKTTFKVRDGRLTLFRKGERFVELLSTHHIPWVKKRHFLAYKLRRLRTKGAVASTAMIMLVGATFFAIQGGEENNLTGNRTAYSCENKVEASNDLSNKAQANLQAPTNSAIIPKRIVESDSKALQRVTKESTKESIDKDRGSKLLAKSERQKSQKDKVKTNKNNKGKGINKDRK